VPRVFLKSSESFFKDHFFLMFPHLASSKKGLIFFPKEQFY
ncbi:hypothetical protein HMPREF1869_00577, partial [Bacteroidales bacterium KA00251]